MFKDNAQTQSYTLGVTGGSKTSTYAIRILIIGASEQAFGARMRMK